MKKAILFSLLSVSFGLASNASTFTSINSTGWSLPTTWVVTGAADADGIPDNDDDVIIANTFFVSQNLAVGTCKTLTINLGGTYGQANKKLNIYGSFTNNGTLSGSGNLLFRASGTITSSTTIGNPGDWYFYATHTITAGTNISKINYFTLYTGSNVTNLGSVYLTSGSLLLDGNWINGANSSLTVGENFTGPGTLTASAVGNTVTYKSSTTTLIRTTNSYYNLSLIGTANHTKSLEGPAALTVANDLLINTFVTLNCNSLNVSVGHNWTNTGNFNCTNMATVTFNGSGTQTITRSSSEVFNNVTFAGTGTVQLACNATVNGTTTLSSGTLNPSTFTYSQKGASWIGNGGNCTVGATGKVLFDGTANQSISGSSGTTFGNVEINNPGFTVSLGVNNTGGGTTTLTAGILDIGTFNWSQSGASWLANGGTLNTAATGSVIFNGSVAQSIGGTVGATFGNIQVSSSNTVSLARNLNVAKNLTINSGTLDASASNFNITITGNFDNVGGAFTCRSGTVTLNGAVAETIGSSASTTFYNLTSSNTSGGVAVTATITVSNILTVSATDFGTSGLGKVTISATGVTTAGKIAPLGAGATLSGTGWIIQSFINGPATANWQYLGSPINGNILSDWDNDTRFYMSGVGGNDGNTSPMFYSVRKYSTVDTWQNITTVSTALTTCKGFSVWMSDNMTGMTAPLVFDSRGIPNFGNKSIALNTAHYTLVSNPYACPVSFASVVAASSGASANFLCWQESGSYVTNPNSGNIGTAQGFMAYAASGGTLNFTEACKNTSANPNLVRIADPENYLRIRTSNDVNGLGGETVIQIMDDAANGLDVNYDLPFLASMYEDATNIWSTDAAGTDLLLNALNGNTENLDIPISVQAGTQGNQFLSFLGLSHFSAYSYATLENVTTGEKVNLKLRDTYSYFAQNVGDKQNFILHLQRTGNCPLCDQNITASLDASTLVYTNNSMIHVKFDFETATDVVINVFDIQGQEVSETKNVTVGSQIIDITNLSAHGIYFVRITKGAEVVTKKIYL